MQFHSRRITHQQRTAEAAHARIKRSLERDLRTDPGGVSRCNGDARQRHGDWLP
jgi:hypothetical protein